MVYGEKEERWGEWIVAINDDDDDLAKVYMGNNI